MKRIYHPYDKWEETTAGMWRRPTGEERSGHIERCSSFMSDTGAFRVGMVRAIDEWPISCEANFTTRTVNRQAWLGHAACCISIGCPEEPTRAAWWTLTQELRDAADAAAAETIVEWERRYRENNGRSTAKLAAQPKPVFAPKPAPVAVETLPLFAGQ